MAVEPSATDLNSAGSGTPGQKQAGPLSYQQELALFVSAFIDELIEGGVRDVVISPGSRSTPLSMVAYASKLNTYIDVDERGAAFFALGRAKATGRGVALIATSGTAVANYYPAVLEAQSSRVPLIVLSSDRPARLQQVGAPQTCDQLKIFSDHVRGFWNMPAVSARPEIISYVRQIAREALIAAAPCSNHAAPVHLNFPFDEPLKPDLSAGGLFEKDRRLKGGLELAPRMQAHRRLGIDQLYQLDELLKTKRFIALCGEGTLGSVCADEQDYYDRRTRAFERLVSWAHAYQVPLLADPLSQLRSYDDELIVENYDVFFGGDSCPDFDGVIRFGRYPISKRVTSTLAVKDHIQLVVDDQSTRDFNSATTTFIELDPVDFIASFDALKSTTNTAEKTTAACKVGVAGKAVATDETAAKGAAVETAAACKAGGVCSIALEGNRLAWCSDWIRANKEAASAIVQAADRIESAAKKPGEGSFYRAIIDHAPNKSLIFSGNSMEIRGFDTFETKGHTLLTMLANRGLNGIDGTLSSAFGSAVSFDQTYCVVGDLTFLHDINALALQNEFRIRAQFGAPVPSITVVVFNNHGGGIFEMLPQKSNEPYFERLFQTPHAVSFADVARAFDVAYIKVETLDAFNQALERWQGDAGIHVIEVPFKLEGLPERYRVS